MPKVLVAVFRDLNYSGGWAKLDVKKYFLALRDAKFWNYREKLRDFLPYIIGRSQSTSHVAGRTQGSQVGGHSHPHRSIIVYISISLEMLYMLLRAPHHEPEKMHACVCVCAHTHLILKQRGEAALFGERTLIKSPSRCTGLKYFSN